MKTIMAVMIGLLPALAYGDDRDPISIQRRSGSGYQAGVEPAAAAAMPPSPTRAPGETSSVQRAPGTSPAPQGAAKWNSKEDVESILTTVEDVKRRPDEVDANVMRRQMLNMFDVRLPRIEQACDRAIAYPLLKLAYNFSRSLPGIDADLLDLASKLKSAGGDRQTFKGVSGPCSVELKSLSTGILSLYRGPSWNNNP